MNAATAFEVVSTAMGLIEWLSDEIDDTADYDALPSLNADIWNVANRVRHAVNGSITWEEAEKAVISIRRRYEE